ncbi:MAG: amidohydrolase, partial [Acidobacteria bacterium]|nr:amidohydrolase [Acidobacteriota bacterium]
MTLRTLRLATLVGLTFPGATFAQAPAPVAADAERRIEAGLRQVVTWRRDFHQHPELGLQETRT